MLLLVAILHISILLVIDTSVQTADSHRYWGTWKSWRMEIVTEESLNSYET